MAHKLDVIIFGATGFTGKWTVFEACKVLKGLQWGVAGRSRNKLEGILQEISAKAQTDLSKTPISVADVSNEDSLEAMTASCRLLVNCCGPYRFYGEPVVRACLKTGTHHLDVSGESHFMELMQLKYDQEAQEKGVYIISACGFDSIPADMGLLYLQKNFDGVLNSTEIVLKSGRKTKLSKPSASINTGTWESAIHAITSMADLKDIRKRLSKERLPKFQPRLQSRPLMSTVEGIPGVILPFPSPDLPVLARSQRFFYETEKKRPVQVLYYLNLPNKIAASVLVLFGTFFSLMTKFNFGRKLLIKYPKFFTFGFISPEGPTEEAMRNSIFTLYLKGSGWSGAEGLLEPTDQFTTPPNSSLTVAVTGENPGYGATCVSILSAAKTVLNESDKMPRNGGVLPPAAAFANTNIIEELEKYEHGLKFKVLEKKNLLNHKL